MGERLVNGEYVRMDVAPGPDGMLRGHSPALGMDLCWDDGRLRFYDVVRDVWVPDYYDLRDAHAAAMERLADEQTARQVAEARMADEQTARQAAEARMADEQTARQTAEARMAEMEAELRRLRGEA